MKTAVDSSVLLDVLGGDPTFGEPSRQALKTAYDAGALAACEIVWAEVRAQFPTDDAFGEALDLLGVQFDPISLRHAQGHRSLGTLRPVADAVFHGRA